MISKSELCSSALIDNEIPTINCSSVLGTLVRAPRVKLGYLGINDKPVVSFDDMEIPIVKDPDKVHPAVHDGKDPEYLNGSKLI